MKNYIHPCILAAIFGCAHGRLQEVPLLVSSDALADDPATTPRAQALRASLLEAMRDGGYCLDRAGDFEGILDLRLSGSTAVLTLDTAAGSRVDEVEGPPDMAALLRDLAASGAVRDFAADAARETECRARSSPGKLR